MVKSVYFRFSSWAALTILLSAFLLFQVQPVISKMILPWFGGTTAVWTTCMLFFQVLLVAGYSYAHVLSRLKSRQLQMIVHVALIVVAVLTLPITPTDRFKPTGSSLPTMRILWLLVLNVGLPYFVLSATGPLVQAWYAMHYSGRSPYRLYALSNIGSLGALVTYPFVFEPAFDLPTQGNLWSVVFVGFGTCCAVLAVMVSRGVSSPSGEGDETTAGEVSPEATVRPPWKEQGHWLWMPALASVMLLAVTQHVCQQIVVMPFLWIAPLGLYLLSFIICFDRESWYLPRVFAWAVFLSISWIAALMLRYDIDAMLQNVGVVFKFSEWTGTATVQVGSYLAMLFAVCMLCHGELVRRKPAVTYLTAFYLWVSVGGAVGGLLVSLVCPLIFHSYLELNLAMLVALVFSLVIVVTQIVSWSSVTQLSAALLIGGGIGLAGKAQLAEYQRNVKSFDVVKNIERETVVASRNFFGVLRVVRELREESPADNQLSLMHGKTLHGIQFTDPGRRRLPTAYYNRNSGIGLLMRKYLQAEPVHVSIVGLGVGTLATYGRTGDHFRFYEINPEVERMAQEYFTFLQDSAADVSLVSGDARLSLEEESTRGAAHDTDILVVDAFSGDAVPVHLLTAEAVQLYLDHLKPGGVLAIHASTQHLRLIPVVARIARHHEIPFVVLTTHPDPEQEVVEDLATWILLTRNEDVLNDPEIRQKHQAPVGENARNVSLWTDKFSALYEIVY
ncbi:MAG: fused MFS/spermidine synthase [Planctomycetota bacterium]|nr:fused MFS/spermidine synthase [Planctomycetota bacterium]